MTVKKRRTIRFAIVRSTNRWERVNDTEEREKHTVHTRHTDTHTHRENNDGGCVVGCPCAAAAGWLLEEGFPIADGVLDSGWLTT